MAFIRNTIEHQLPSHVVKDYPLFVDFLKGYYEWLELPDNPFGAIKSHLDWLDFKDSLDTYIEFLKKEYLFSVPSAILGNAELFVKYSKDFFSSLGTEKSFQFLFSVLFGDSAGDVELYYPKRDMLITSDGKWIDDEKVLYVTHTSDPEDFLYGVIKQEREIFPGIFQTAQAVVQKVTTRYASKFKFSELYLSAIDGEFQLGYQVGIDTHKEWILPTGNLITLTNSGTGYTIDDAVKVLSPNNFVQTITASLTGMVDTMFTTVLTQTEIAVEIDSIPVTNFVYDGINIIHSSIVPGSVVNVTFPSYKGFVIIESVGTNGSIVSFDIIDSPIGIFSDTTLQINGGSGVGAVATIGPGLVRDIKGYYLNDDGHLSSTKRLQDSNFYQDYSYVIKSNLDVTKYRDIVLKVLHPAGMKMFGQINIVELIKLMIRNFTIDITKKPADILLESSVDMGSTYGVLDRLKNKFSEKSFHTSQFQNIVVGDVVNNWMKQVNVYDVLITLYAQYFAPSYILDQDNYIGYDPLDFAEEII